ncbi:hypothetical protein F4803DRAFT_550600 [Xylaria telfairii]|nr:hypothetical protein F4803DRAFT_550600 [Xylaria telfairii]
MANNRNAPEPIRAKILRLQSITNYLASCETMAAKVRVLLHFGHQRDLVDLALLSPFESMQELVQGLEVLFPGGKRLLAQEEDYFDNSLNIEIQESLPKFMPYSSVHCAARLDSNKGESVPVTVDDTLGSESVSSQSDELAETTDPTELEPFPGELAQEEERDMIQDKEDGGDNDPIFDHGLNLPCATNSEPGEILYCVGGASLTAHENAPRPFVSNGGRPGNVSGSEHEHGISIRQNYAPWEGPPSNRLSVIDKVNIQVEETKFHCLTQGYAGGTSSHLRIHLGRNKAISRWHPGSKIKYSIDYDSFLSGARSRDDADYALKCLQNALEVWNCLDVDIHFEFPWWVSYDHRDGVQAMSFFPIEAAQSSIPREVYIFSAAFDTELRLYMTNTFLHEVAHILGGRHEDPKGKERNDPSVQLGRPNALSVLVSGRHPRDISVHWQDIRWFHHFMRYREGHKINGLPIRNIAP